MDKISRVIDGLVYRKCLAIVCAVLTLLMAYDFWMIPRVGTLGGLVMVAGWSVINANKGFQLQVPSWLTRVITWLVIVGFVLSVVSYFK